YQQNAAVVLVNKGKRSNLDGILATCRLAMADIRHVVYDTPSPLYGDKETYWIGFEIAEANYSFARHPMGAIGSFVSDSDDVLVCGNSLYFGGASSRPFWFNSGIVKTKFRSDEQLRNYEAVGRNAFFVEGHGPCCKGDESGFFTLNKKEKQTMEALKRMWQ